MVDKIPVRKKRPVVEAATEFWGIAMNSPAGIAGLVSPSDLGLKSREEAVAKADELLSRYPHCSFKVVYVKNGDIQE